MQKTVLHTLRSYSKYALQVLIRHLSIFLGSLLAFLPFLPSRSLATHRTKSMNCQCFKHCYFPSLPTPLLSYTFFIAPNDYVVLLSTLLPICPPSLSSTSDKLLPSNSSALLLQSLCCTPKKPCMLKTIVLELLQLTFTASCCSSTF